MKRTPQFVMVFLAVLALMLSACAANGASPASMDWRLLSYGSMESQTAALADIDTFMTLHSDGKVSGNMGCNRMGGEYAIWGQTLTFTNVYATEMACSEPQMNQESIAFQVLQGNTTYTRDGDLLTVTSADGNQVLVFTVFKAKLGQ